jgi:hypothetical protein
MVGSQKLCFMNAVFKKGDFRVVDSERAVFGFSVLVIVRGRELAV